MWIRYLTVCGFFILLAGFPACTTDEPGSDQPAGSGTHLDANFQDVGSSDGGIVRDVPGEGPDDAGQQREPTVEGCIWQEFYLKPEMGSVPNVLLVVDHSNSMNDENRWPTMTTALRTLTSNLDDVVNFGLVLFPPPGVDLYHQCDTGELVVSLGANRADAISQQLDALPNGGTPTAMTLYVARHVLLDTGSDPPGYVLLATDGGPGCNASLDPWTCECLAEDCSLNSDNCLDDLRTLQAVDDLFSADIRTFVIGIPGTEPFGDLLDAMAIRGGTDVDYHHFSVTDGPQLQEALSQATGSVVPCVYELDEPPLDPNSVTIRIDGEQVPRDESSQNGWGFDDEQTIHFFGPACDLLRDGVPHDISAEYEWCP